MSFTRVAIMLFDGIPLFEASVPIAVFGERRPGMPEFDVRAVSAEGGPIRTDIGVTLAAPHDLGAVDDAELVVVPTWRRPSDGPPPAREALDALRRAHRRGATVVGLCLGTFVVAAAGLLDGRGATTHWRYASLLAEMYPDVDVRPDVLYVDEGDVLTSAGSAGGIDLCLHLVRRTYGPKLAGDIARSLVVPPHRAGGQAQYIDHPVPPPSTGDPLGETLDWALRNLDRELTVGTLSARAMMSRRTFDRRFRQATGTTPAQWLLHQRVLQAQRLLESTREPVERVARSVGFASAVALRPHFRRRVGVSPSAYRETFGAAPDRTPVSRT
ncbi:transcriptional regulator GlxA family with amidase domain [Streptosporangium becharense]|uniref:Transcriptional regulator GlxA family with amidase domain n=1 Tax=Streptosporangium becharense TaxID=1816182 RepID=A0A7W9IK07_9ACTN|nr:helix-turn-helix domain-containing protein [Streptosporangium becharense]MBB2913870.1 transcriptional regulator GlxA family with amidase domain [Streptosporangium becharense]MBB5821469.1 transcriptional regulator GlxA family with amidase domain [Streptosporangium becharense]